MIQSSALWSGKKLLYNGQKFFSAIPPKFHWRTGPYGNVVSGFCAGVGSVFINISVGGSVLKACSQFQRHFTVFNFLCNIPIYGVWKPMVLPVYVLFLCLLSLDG